MIDALIQTYRLKDEVRTGWRLRGITDPESVADHSWGTAYLVLLHADEAGVDRGKALEIALVHDIAEAITGDVPTRVAGMDDPRRKKEKYAREREAVARLLGDYPHAQATRVRQLWQEYEENRTPEAKFVRDMNLVDMCLQACRYELDRRYNTDDPNPSFPEFPRLDEFFMTAAARIRTDSGRALFERVAERYSLLVREDSCDE